MHGNFHPITEGPFQVAAWFLQELWEVPIPQSSPKMSVMLQRISSNNPS